MTLATFEKDSKSTAEGSHGTVVYNITSQTAFGSIVIRALEITGPATSKELAREMGVSELIVRSVLQALTAVDCVHFDTADGRYALFCNLPAIS